MAKKTTSSNGTFKVLKPHRLVLSALATAKAPMSRRAIADKVGRQEKLVNGRIAQETLTYTALEKLDMVKGKQLGGPGEEINEYAYMITPKGKSALAAAK